MQNRPFVHAAVLWYAAAPLWGNCLMHTEATAWGGRYWQGASGRQGHDREHDARLELGLSSPL